MIVSKFFSASWIQSHFLLVVNGSERQYIFSYIFYAFKGKSYIRYFTNHITFLQKTLFAESIFTFKYRHQQHFQTPR